MCSKQSNKSHNDQPQGHDTTVVECKTIEEEEGKEEKGDPENINTNPPSPPDPSISFITEKTKKYDDPSEEELGEDENTVTRGLEIEEDPEGIRGICNFIGRVKGMHIFVGNFAYVSGFMIVEDISSIIDTRLSQVVLGKPFVKISNMTYDLSLRVVRFMIGIDEIAYKMPHKIEQYNSLSDLEKEHIKSVYFRNVDPTP
ncbi:hypothetical protein Tco_0498888 [Tanacetum coccineum]